MKHTIKKILREALGVPENISESAKILFNEIIAVIEPQKDIQAINDIKYRMDISLEVGDVKINKVILWFYVYIDNDENLEVISLTTHNRVTLTDDMKFQYVIGHETFEMSISVVSPENKYGSDLIETIKGNKKVFISDLSHELMHFYDAQKRKIDQVHSRARYNAASNQVMGIQPLNTMLFNMYYSHEAENIVRPSQLLTIINQENITKQQFKNYLLTSNVYNTYREIRDFSVNQLRKDLYNYIPEIKEFFKQLEIDFSEMSEDEIVEECLKMFYINVANWRSESAERLMIVHPLEKLFGITDKEKVKFLEKLTKNNQKFGEDYQKFFDYEEKLFNFVGKNMIKKLAKLYELAK